MSVFKSIREDCLQGFNGSLARSQGRLAGCGSSSSKKGRISGQFPLMRSQSQHIRQKQHVPFNLRPFTLTMQVPQSPFWQFTGILTRTRPATTVNFCPTTAPGTGFPLTVTFSLMLGPFLRPAFCAGPRDSSLAKALERPSNMP